MSTPEDEIRAGFERLEARADEPVAKPGPALAVEESTPSDWAQPVHAGLQLFSAQAPNWTIEEAHAQIVEDALCDVLDDLLPGGLKNIDQWGPYAKLAFGCGCIALANFDWTTKHLKPLRATNGNENTTQSEPGRKADSDYWRQPQREDGANAA
jgi:hypothetical protein